MKWILPKNILFDTATATLIASWSNGRHFSDPAFNEENLYRSQTGGFFLVGNQIDGTPSGDSRVDRCRQLTPEETLRWCARRHQEHAAARHLRETLHVA